jgi:small-conductance mechanosensitive channel
MPSKQLRNLKRILILLLVIIIILYLLTIWYIYIDKQIEKTIASVNRFIMHYHYHHYERTLNVLNQCILCVRKGEIQNVFNLFADLINEINHTSYNYPYKKLNIERELSLLIRYFEISTPYLEFTHKFFYIHYAISNSVLSGYLSVYLLSKILKYLLCTILVLIVLLEMYIIVKESIKQN